MSTSIHQQRRVFKSRSSQLHHYATLMIKEKVDLLFTIIITLFVQILTDFG